MKKRFGLYILIGTVVLVSCSTPPTNFEAHTQYVQDYRTKLCFLTTKAIDDFVVTEVPCTNAVLSNLTNEINSSAED